MTIFILTLNSGFSKELIFWLVILILGMWLLYDGLITLKGTKKQILSFVYYFYLPMIGIIFGKAQKERYLSQFTTQRWRRLLALSAIFVGIGSLLLVISRIFNI